LKPATRRIIHFRDFSFADFRTRTPGPPPFSSMNSTPAPFSLQFADLQGEISKMQGGLIRQRSETGFGAGV